ncbi:MAG: hypothetical protein M1829_004675 [Trizodia sp. TS-e1964]|nr:MAG: hypothetical protein M1829_004675 [Trizodia sp. TS-e1964]
MTSVSSYPRIILFGDSLTEKSFDPALRGFGAALQHHYARRADVLNRGYGGYNTRWLLPRLSTLLTPLLASQPPPALLVLLIGTNDAVPVGRVHHVPLDEFTSNLQAIVTHVRSTAPTTALLLVTPPPIDMPNLKGMFKRPAGAWEVVEKYADEVQGVGAEFDGVEVLDTWKLLLGDGNAGSGNAGAKPLGPEVLCDGLHLGVKGNQALFTGIKKSISTAWPSLAIENMPLQAPWWGDLPEARNSPDAIARRAEIEAEKARGGKDVEQ